MNRRLTCMIGFGLLAAAVSLGCGFGGSGSDTGTVNEGGGGTTPPTVSSAAPAKKIAQMGVDSVTLENGAVITTSKPAKFTPSGTAAGHQPGNTAITVVVTIQNKGQEPMDLTLTTVTAAIGKDGTQANPVYDSAKGIGDGFQSTIAPGQQRTAKYAFSAATKDTSLIAVTVAPGLMEGTALFEGRLS